MTIIVSDPSIKNQVATLITYIHIHNKTVIKILHYVVNITFTKAELCAIRCGINQATQVTNINYIIIITDSIYRAKQIFNSSIHLYQIQLPAISRELREFFKRDQ